MKTLRLSHRACTCNPSTLVVRLSCECDAVDGCPALQLGTGPAARGGRTLILLPLILFLNAKVPAATSATRPVESRGAV